MTLHLRKATTMPLLRQLLCFFFLTLRASMVHSQWWFLSRLSMDASGLQPSVTSVVAWCNSAPGLVSRQRTLCRQSPAVMLVLVQSGQLSLRECQHHFRTERWNCSALANDNSGLNKFMQQGTREAAFVYAVSSAAFAHSITRACSAGKMERCSCDPARRFGVGHDVKGQFQWGGCSDHIKFGSRYARKFLDARYRDLRNIGLLSRRSNTRVRDGYATVFPGSSSSDSSDMTSKTLSETESVRALMNLHNNRAGRRAVMKHKRLLCKCHGVSGACSMRTCWRSMHDLRIITGFLRRQFDTATAVQPNFDGSGRLELINYNSNHQIYDNLKEPLTNFPLQRPTKSTLVYVHKSPNYCVHNTEFGVVGTSGRECNNTSTGSDSCAILCCGSGYDTFSVTMTHKCKCKFYWCCKVKCKLCTGIVEKHRCKTSPRDTANIIQ